MRLRVFLRTATVFGALLAAPLSSVFASTIVFSDNFNKADQALVPTTPNISTGNWTQTGTITTNPVQIVSNKVPLTTGQDVYAAFSAAVPNSGDGSVIHTSMDINVSAVPAGGDYFSHLSDPVGTTGTFLQRLGAAPTTGGFLLNLAETGGGGATTSAGITVLNLNQSYHVDVYWTFVAGAINDTFQVNVDNIPYLSKTWTSTTVEPTQVSSANLRQGGAATAPTLTVDNLQVESIPAVPEPTTLFLAGLMGLASVAWRGWQR